MTPMHVLERDDTVQAIIASKRAELMLAQATQTHAAELARANALLAHTQRNHYERACSLQQQLESIKHAHAALTRHAAALDVALATTVVDAGPTLRAGLLTAQASLAARVMHHLDLLAAECTSDIDKRLGWLQHRLDRCTITLLQFGPVQHHRRSSASVDMGTVRICGTIERCKTHTLVAVVALLGAHHNAMQQGMTAIHAQLTEQQQVLQLQTQSQQQAMHVCTAMAAAQCSSLQQPATTTVLTAAHVAMQVASCVQYTERQVTEALDTCTVALGRQSLRLDMLRGLVQQATALVAQARCTRDANAAVLAEARAQTEALRVQCDTLQTRCAQADMVCVCVLWYEGPPLPSALCEWVGTGGMCCSQLGQATCC